MKEVAREPPPRGGQAREQPLRGANRAIEALLLEKGVLTEPEIQDRISYMEARSPANGAKLVARAWVSPEFKELLLSDTKAAAQELGIDASGPVEFVVVENTPEVHNLIVCTLCSCYPRAILGRPPDWYKSFNYRSRAVREPRAVMRELGFEPPRASRSPSTTARPISATWCFRCARQAT